VQLCRSLCAHRACPQLRPIRYEAGDSVAEVYRRLAGLEGAGTIRQQFDDVKVVDDADLDQFVLVDAIDEVWCLEPAP